MLTPVGSPHCQVREMMARHKDHSVQDVRILLQGIGAVLTAIFVFIGSFDCRRRHDFECQFFAEFVPVMENWLVYPDDLEQAVQNKLVRVDAPINFFEHIAYLSECAEFLRKDGLESMFRFLFELMQTPTHAILERYLLRGLESLQQNLNIRPVRCSSRSVAR